MSRDDRRSPEAAVYRAWYKTARWARIRKRQLADHPLCQWCLGKPTPRIVEATVCHHIEPHRGDVTKFYQGPFASLCKACHDGEAQQVEVRGYSTTVGVDGWPVDPQHPVNKGP